MIIHIKETSPIIASIGFPLSRDYEDVGLDLMLLIEPLEGQLLVPTSVATLMIAVGSSMRRAIIPWAIHVFPGYSLNLNTPCTIHNML